MFFARENLCIAKAVKSEEGNTLSQLVVASKRFLLVLYTTALVWQSSFAGATLARVAQTWWQNRTTIVLLTAVNTTITTVNEAVSRTIQAPIAGSRARYGFVVSTPSGGLTIHRQSLINIAMTIIVSLFGGPVFFFAHRRNRFAFFCLLGLTASVLAQLMVSHWRDGQFLIDQRRLLFDLGYMVSIKYGLFELGRRPILSARQSNVWQKGLAQIGSIRILQDLFTTLIKVGLLNAFRFHG